MVQAGWDPHHHSWVVAGTLAVLCQAVSIPLTIPDDTWLSNEIRMPLLPSEIQYSQCVSNHPWGLSHFYLPWTSSSFCLLGNIRKLSKTSFFSYCLIEIELLFLFYFYFLNFYYSWFTMYSQFLLYSKVTHAHIYTFFFSHYPPSCSITSD